MLHQPFKLLPITFCRSAERRLIFNLPGKLFYKEFHRLLPMFFPFIRF